MYGYSFFTDNAGVIVNNKGEMKGERKETVTDFGEQQCQLFENEMLVNKVFLLTESKLNV